ncbi:MAG: fumarylacetoacetate hydrolase family protein [Actinomycetota bacterium]|nr:fumarylacetoacetate hydrolase family protein [Actinomycetota bacterium]
MRIVRFAHPQGMSFGTVEADGDLAQIEGHPFGSIVHTGARFDPGDVRLLSPILPSKVIGVGHNYADHQPDPSYGVQRLTPGRLTEMGNEVPAEPTIFLKPSTAVIGPGDAIRLTDLSHDVQHEAELAVVIGATGARRVTEANALDSVFGYTCGNDVTARDLQKKDVQFTRAKGFDSFCPIGPWIDTDFDPSDVEVRCEVDGEVRQLGRTSQLIHSIPKIIAFISQVMTLLPGDVIMTGTPAGVGPITAGQRVDVIIENLGTLPNPVVSQDGSTPAPAGSTG